MTACARLALAATVLAVCASALPVATAAAPARTQVVADEWRLTPSRTTFKPGTVKVEVVNMGEDDHDFVIARAGGGLRYDSAIINPGKRAEFSFKLKRGTYKLWCSLGNHKSRGMQSKLKVRR